MMQPRGAKSHARAEHLPLQISEGHHALAVVIPPLHFPFPTALVLLFLAGWNGFDILFRVGLRFRRGCRAPQLRRYAITRPQPGALDRSDEFAARWLFRLYLNQRLVANLGRRSLSECGCRKADRGKNQ